MSKRLSEKLTSGQTHLSMVKKEGKSVLMSNPTSIPLESSTARNTTQNVMIPPSVAVQLNRFEKDHVEKASNGGTL